jgi:imidazolonepropionase-like amidohydrolase
MLLLLRTVIGLSWQASLSAAGGETVALTGATIYPSPTDTPIANGVVLIRDGKIVAVGKRGSLRVPSDARQIDCTGLFITAGFQNGHVHFTERKREDAPVEAAPKLAQQLEEMLTRYGFTSLVDTGSTLTNTVALRSRIESGEVPGPRIRTADLPLYPPGGTPFYLKDAVPPATLAFIESNLEPTAPEAAVAVVRQDIAGGADVIKLFTGSLASPTKVVPMDAGVARAAVAEAHSQARLVFAHPSNLDGLEIALNAGVDVVAHTTPISGKWDDNLIARMKQRHMSLTPTLKLWIDEASRGGATAEQAESFADRGVGELRQYKQAGGQVLFGTDVGYMTDDVRSDRGVPPDGARGAHAHANSGFADDRACRPLWRIPKPGAHLRWNGCGYCRAWRRSDRGRPPFRVCPLHDPEGTRNLSHPKQLNPRAITSCATPDPRGESNGLAEESGPGVPQP